MKDDDFVICGYKNQGNHVSSIVLGQFYKGNLRYISSVSLGVSKGDYKKILKIENISKEFYNDFPDKDNVEWIKPLLVCTVRFMERTISQGLRQPVFKGIREDKKAEECLLRLSANL